MRGPADFGLDAEPGGNRADILDLAPDRQRDLGGEIDRAVKVQVDALKSLVRALSPSVFQISPKSIGLGTVVIRSATAMPNNSPGLGGMK